MQAHPPTCKITSQWTHPGLSFSLRSPIPLEDMQCRERKRGGENKGREKRGRWNEQCHPHNIYMHAVVDKLAELRACDSKRISRRGSLTCACAVANLPLLSRGCSAPALQVTIHLLCTCVFVYVSSLYLSPHRHSYYVRHVERNCSTSTSATFSQSCTCA